MLRIRLEASHTLHTYRKGHTLLSRASVCLPLFAAVRLFDLRSLERSTIIYESAENQPILRLSWNKLVRPSPPVMPIVRSVLNASRSPVTP